MSRGMLIGLAIAVGLIGGFAIAGPRTTTPERGPASEFDGPDVPAELREGTGRALIERHCLMCHGLPLITGQRLTEAQWTGTVKKMREKFHAPIPEGSEDAAQLVALLARVLPPELPPRAPATTWPPTGPEPVPSLAAIVDGVDAAAAKRGADLFASKCAVCHGPAGDGGPAAPRLIGRAILADAAEFQLLLMTGRGLMPAAAETDTRAARELLAYLRARTGEEAK